MRITCIMAGVLLSTAANASADPTVDHAQSHASEVVVESSIDGDCQTCQAGGAQCGDVSGFPGKCGSPGPGCCGSLWDNYCRNKKACRTYSRHRIALPSLPSLGGCCDNVLQKPCFTQPIALPAIPVPTVRLPNVFSRLKHLGGRHSFCDSNCDVADGCASCDADSYSEGSFSHGTVADDPNGSNYQPTSPLHNGTIETPSDLSPEPVDIEAPAEPIPPPADAESAGRRFSPFAFTKPLLKKNGAVRKPLGQTYNRNPYQAQMPQAKRFPF